MKNRCSRFISHIEISTSNDFVLIKDGNAFRVVDIFAGTLFSEKTFFNTPGAIKINGRTIALMKIDMICVEDSKIFDDEFKVFIAIPDPLVGGAIPDFVDCIP